MLQILIGLQERAGIRIEWHENGQGGGRLAGLGVRLLSRSSIEIQRGLDDFELVAFLVVQEEG